MGDESSELSRELPPLDTEKCSDIDQSKDRSKSKKVVFIAITIAVVLLFVAIATVITVVSGSSENRMESENQTLSILEGEDLVAVSVLDMDGDSQGSVEQSVDQSDPLLMSENQVTYPLMQNQSVDDEPAEPEFNLTLSDFNAVSDRVDALDSMLKSLANGLSTQESDADIKLSARLNQHDKKVTELEEQVAYLVKEVKRLKWLERQKRVSRKKVDDLPVVTSFFIWQYRPGVELVYKGSSGRFYEGDLLDGMRVLKIDNHLERVVLSKKGKEVVLTLSQGAG